MKEVKTIIGIDPDRAGAFAVIESSPKGQMPRILVIESMPYDFIDLKYIKPEIVGFCRKIRKKYSCIHAVIEALQFIPGNSNSSVGKLGLGTGFIEGVLSALNMTIHTINPQYWKGRTGLLGKDKGESVKLCHKLYGADELHCFSICGPSDHGRADALLMAYVFNMDRNLKGDP